MKWKWMPKLPLHAIDLPARMGLNVIWSLEPDRGAHL